MRRLPRAVLGRRSSPVGGRQVRGEARLGRSQICKARMISSEVAYASWTIERGAPTFLLRGTPQLPFSTGAAAAEDDVEGEETVELAGFVDHVRYTSKVKAGSGHYCVFTLRECTITSGGATREEYDAKVAGILPEKVVKGKEVRVTASRSEHPIHGDQFDIVRILEPTQDKTSAVERYLMDTVPRVGEKTARLIYKYFGEETWDVISNSPERLGEIEELPESRAASIAQHMKKNNDEHLQSLFRRVHEHGISLNMCKRIMAQFGEGQNPLDSTAIREDPYVLLEVRGLSFERVDTIALNVIGCPRDSPMRFNACVRDWTITKNYDGHTAFEVEALCQELTEEPYGYGRQDLSSLLRQMIRAESIVHVEYDNKEYVQHPEMYDLELGISECIHNIQKSNSSLPRVDPEAKVADAEESSDFDSFSEKQKEGLLQALGEDKVTVLTGGPGTGKTAVLGSLVHILRGMGARIRAVAPTGVAAKRLSDSADVSASTIHRLLKYNALGESEYDEDNTLQVDFVIVDETSMLDTSLASALLRALPSFCHLLVVGDDDQLPSVGPGKVLASLIESKRVPVTKLTEPYRQSEGSKIALAAHAVNRGKLDESLPADMVVSGVSELSAEKSIQFVEIPDSELLEAVSEMTSFISEDLGHQSVLDYHMLTPQRKLKDLINEQRQKQNPKPFIRGMAFKKHDKVMQTRNDYRKEIFNGMKAMSKARAKMKKEGPS